MSKALVYGRSDSLGMLLGPDKSSCSCLYTLASLFLQSQVAKCFRIAESLKATACKRSVLRALAGRHSHLAVIASLHFLLHWACGRQFASLTTTFLVDFSEAA